MAVARRVWRVRRLHGVYGVCGVCGSRAVAWQRGGAAAARQWRGSGSATVAWQAKAGGDA
ncbi:MAG: hypothetical protein RSB04_00080 [Gordonibacter sp.]|uniref:hypothetical protein n=1 Tax=Gordonibacter sp. TaxID=1968902 RepID=UPI002FCB5979